jgi:hypothetical protein
MAFNVVLKLQTHFHSNFGNKFIHNVIECNGFTLNVLFNGDVNCEGYMTSVIEKRILTTGEMILTMEKRDIQRKTCPTATLSTINLTGTGLPSNLDLSGEWPATTA